MDAASRYNLHARRLEGPLNAPTRDDTERVDSDDWPALVYTAERLADRGFTVWLCDHGRTGGLRGTSDLRLLREIHPSSAQHVVNPLHSVACEGS